MIKLIIDADPGVDDAQAIILALSSPNVKVLGITCSHGNTPIDQVCQNTLRVLDVCRRMDVPVYRGCTEPVLSKKLHASGFHGRDGLGDVPDSNAPGLDHIQSEDAVSAMIRMIYNNPGEVNLVCMAPLTNIAMAIKRDPALSEKLKGLYIMGGNMHARGNTTVCGEFNFVADSEAAYMVLDKYICPTYIATWEFTCLSVLPWSFFDECVTQGTDKARFVGDIYKYTRQILQSERYRNEHVGIPGFNPCDSFIMAVAIDNSLILESEKVSVTVELDGKHTRSMMVLDYLKLLRKEHKATILKKIDLEKFKRMFMTALQ